MHLLKGGVLFGFMILPTICLGATFPLVGKIYTRSVSSVGRSLGVAYAINSAGSVAGSFCAGFLLIPLIGKENGLSVVIGVQLLSALAMTTVIKDSKGRKRLFKSLPLAGAAFCGLLCCVFYPEWDRRLLAEGRYHRVNPLVLNHSWSESLLKGPEILGRYVEDELVFYGDGIGGFTTVQESADALGNVEYIMRNSGKADASSRGDMMTQCLLAHFPMLFHEKAETVMVLGLASGITAGEVLHYPVRQIDVIDISPQVVEGSNYFKRWNNEVLEDDRTNLIIQDARAHLALTEQFYDVIISEPSNPWMAGLAALFTRDFFDLAENRLNDNGIFVQFFHSYQMDWSTFSMVGRTFSEVFENSYLVSTMPSGHSGDFSDYLLVGIKGDKVLSLENAEKNLRFVQKSKNVTLLDPKVFYRLVVSDKLRELFGEGVSNSDNRPRLEFAAPKLMYHSDQVISDKLQANMSLGEEMQAIVSEITGDIDSQIEFASYALSVYVPFRGMVDLERASGAQKERFFELMVGYCSANPIDYSLIDSEELAHSCRLVQIDAIGKRLSEMPDKVLSLLYLCDLFYAEERFDDSIAACRSALKVEPDSSKALRRMGYLLMDTGNPVDAVPYFEKALQINPEYLDVGHRLAIALVRLGRYDEGINRLKEVLDIDPELVNVHISMGLILFNLGRYDEAAVHCRAVLKLAPNVASHHINLGTVLIRQGRHEEAIDQFRKAVRIDPDDARWYNSLGLGLMGADRLEEAISNFKQALELKPDYSEAGGNLEKALGLQRNR